jgi:ankyrin repeat protein
VDVEGESRKISLHTTSLRGSVDILQWLLNHGADVNARQADNCTLLHLATFYSRPESVQMLLEHNTDINLRMTMTLLRCARPYIIIALLGMGRDI